MVSLLVILVFMSSGATTVNHAKLINHCHDVTSYTPTYKEELVYTFKVADKLVGNGAIKLTIEKNKIRGTATGLGMVTQCDIDFLTSIEGTLNSKSGDIDVIVTGEGNPLKIPVPGKVSFYGPLKGFLKNDKLILVGKVNIKGYLAHCAGFKNKEDLLIEMPLSPLYIAQN